MKKKYFGTDGIRGTFNEFPITIPFFINLTDLQSDNYKFLHFLKYTYNINIKNKIITIDKHTKDKENKTITIKK